MSKVCAGISKTIAIGIVAIVIIAAICGGYYYFIISQPKPTEKDRIRIGIAVSLSGSYSDLGRHLLRGYNIWKDVVNAKGGIYVAEYNRKLPVEFVVYDDTSSPEKAVELVERLITIDKVDFIFGGYGSPIVTSETTVTEKYGVPYINTQGYAESIYTRGYKWIFSTCPQSPLYAKRSLDLLMSIPADKRPTKVAFLYEDSAVCRDHVTFLKGFIANQSLPLQVVYEERYAKGTTDFTSSLLSVKASGADAFFAISYTRECILITKQMKEVGYYPTYFNTAMGASTPEYIQTLGPDGDGAITAYIAGPEVNPEYAKGFDELWQVFTQLFKPEDWHYCVATGYSGGQLLEAAIEKAGSIDCNKIRQAMLEIDILTVVGPVKVAEDGRNIKSDYILAQIQNQKRVVVWPPEAMMPGTQFKIPCKAPP